MSCSDIKVQLLGDAADILVYVQQAQAAVSAAQQAEAAAQGSATQAAQDVVSTNRSASAAAASAVDAESYEQQSNAHMLAAQQAVGDSRGHSLDAQAAANAASASATAASASAAGAATDATRAEAAATRAENAPVRLKISDEGKLLHETASEFNFIGAGVTVKQNNPGDLSIFEIEIPGHPAVAVADVTGLQAALDGKEPALGRPASDYMVLASKTDGTRYWIAQAGTGNSALLAGPVGQLQRSVNDLQLGTGLRTTFNGQTCTIQCEITKADLDALSARVTALYAPTEAAWDNAFQAAIAQYVQRLAAVETSASASAAHIAALQLEADANKQLVQKIENSVINKVESRVNAGAKTITLTYKNGNSVIDTDLIDISGMFGSPAPTAVPIWYGFTASKPMTDQAVKAGSSELESVVVGKDIELKRADSAPKYMYVWIPDSLGAISGFSFNHAFLDVWQSYALVVDGVAGKAYISDNQTVATDISFEVQ